VKNAPAGAACFINEFRHDIGADHLYSFGAELAGEPSFAAADIKDGAWVAVQYGIDDGLISNLLATFHLSFTYSGNPGLSVKAPGFYDLRVVELAALHVASLGLAFVHDMGEPKLALPESSRETRLIGF